jgi:hypothetical protein
MGENTFEANLDGSVQGFVQGDYANVAMHFHQFPSTSTSFLTYRGILSVPPLTDSYVIQQRTSLVEAIYAKLTQPDLNALVLTGIGGTGKSTLAALVYHFTEKQQQAGTGSFAAPSLWITIDTTVTFADLIGTIYQELGESFPDLSKHSLFLIIQLRATFYLNLEPYKQDITTLTYYGKRSLCLV